MEEPSVIPRGEQTLNGVMSSATMVIATDYEYVIIYFWIIFKYDFVFALKVA